MKTDIFNQCANPLEVEDLSTELEEEKKSMDNTWVRVDLTECLVPKPTREDVYDE